MSKLFGAQFWFGSHFGKTYVSKYSRTPVRRCGYIEAFGERQPAILRVNKEGDIDYTHEEIAAMAVACVACGKPIWLGDPIGLLVPGEGFEIPKGAYLYEPEQAYVACFRWECEHPFGRGFWLPTETDPLRCDVFRTAGPDEMLMANPEMECVIVNDTRDIDQAIANTNALLQQRQSPASE